MSEPLPHAGLRVPRPLLDRADRLVSHVAEIAPELTSVTRADVLRRALIIGLREMERGAAGTR